MGYSLIETVEIKNFMSFKHAKVSFDESNIINIKGYNDSGKSAILRAIAVCTMDKYRSKQAKFIRHNEDYFRIVITFNDGVAILRDKYKNGQSLYEMYKDNELIFTTKQGNKLSKVDGVPKPIEEYLGLCVTDSVYLNYQSNEDKLPISDFSGSENYQLFHVVLRMEEIYRANAMINLDKNELGSQIAGIEMELQRDEMIYDSYGDISQEFIDRIAQLEEESIATNKRMESLKGISTTFKGVKDIPSIPHINGVDTNRYRALSSIESTISSIKGIPSVPDIAKVDGGRLALLESMGNAITRLSGYSAIPEIPKVDTHLVDRYSSLGKLVTVFKNCVSSAERFSSLDKEILEYKSRMSALVAEAEKLGHKVVKCGNCGTYTIAEGVGVDE